MRELTVAAKHENLARVIELVGSEDMQIDIAIEEAFINICSYAYADIGGSGDVTIRAEQTANTLAIEFEDSGTPYNPLDKPEPDDLDAETSEEKNVGGYGVYMVRRLMDSVSYRREDGKNILTITKNVDGDS